MAIIYASGRERSSRIWGIGLRGEDGRYSLSIAAKKPLLQFHNNPRFSAFAPDFTWKARAITLY